MKWTCTMLGGGMCNLDGMLQHFYQPYHHPLPNPFTSFTSNRSCYSFYLLFSYLTHVISLPGQYLLRNPLVPYLPLLPTHSHILPTQVPPTLPLLVAQAFSFIIFHILKTNFLISGLLQVVLYYITRYCYMNAIHQHL